MWHPKMEILHLDRNEPEKLVQLLTTHHFVCMMSKTTLFATLKKWRQQLEDCPIHRAHDSTLVTTYIQANGRLSCEIVASAKRINYSKITPS